MSVFITGTDTDVGKTALTGLLLAALLDDGIDAVPMKPVQTGCEGSLVPDMDFYERATGRKFENRRLHVPYLYEPACSPHLAAKMAGKHIEIGRIIDSFQQLQAAHETVLVEGAGGIMVPLNESELMLDLMKALELPVLLASRPGLGTINHTLLSLDVLRNAGLDVLGVVIVESYAFDRTFIEDDNARAIEKYGDVPVLATLPHFRNMGEPDFSFDSILPKMNRLLKPVVAALRNR